MPLHKGRSAATVSGNIKEMVAAGHPQRQAVAAAMREKDESGGHMYADADVKKVPAIAVTLGHAEPDGDEGPGEDGGDSDEAAIHDAGHAAMQAYAAGDPVAFAKAVAACARVVPDDEADEDEGGDETVADMDMAKHGHLGSGSRFAAVEKSAAESGARDPGAVAAAAGRAAHGQRAMTRYSKMGR